MTPLYWIWNSARLAKLEVF